MEKVIDFATNPYLLTAISSWLIAQFLKLIIYTIANRKFDISRLYGDGGMPSGHSATVSSLAVICGLSEGFGSVAFALAFVFAMIVCHDAMGVRRETGKQAVILNEILESFNLLAKKNLPEEKLKEFVGHTPVQVFSGVLLGIVNAIVMYFLLIK